MRGRIRLIVVHWIDSLCVSVIAAVSVLVLRFYTFQYWDLVVDGLAIRAYLIPTVAALLLLLPAIVWPVRFVVSLKSIRLFPKHCGMCVRAMAGILRVLTAETFDVGRFPGPFAFVESFAGAAIETAVGSIGAFAPHIHGLRNRDEGAATEAACERFTRRIKKVTPGTRIVCVGIHGKTVFRGGLKAIIGKLRPRTQRKSGATSYGGSGRQFSALGWSRISGEITGFPVFRKWKVLVN